MLLAGEPRAHPKHRSFGAELAGPKCWKSFVMTERSSTLLSPAGIRLSAISLLIGVLALGCTRTADGDNADGQGAGGMPTDVGGGGGSGDGGGRSEDGEDPVTADACEAPTPWPLPDEGHVVGTGSAASCTEGALRDAIASGGYVTFDCGAEPVTIDIGSAIEVKSPTVVDGAERITLDGKGSSQILVVRSNASLSVRNLRFINGKAPATMEVEGIGGAVAGLWRSRVEVIGCTFEDNTASRGGGAVAVWTGSELTVVASRFHRNHSWYGGAIYSLLSPLTVSNSEFVDNSNTKEDGLGDGGAIGTDGASEHPDDGEGGAVEICGSYFEGNHAYGQGGAAYVWVYPPDTVLIDRTTVRSNSVDENVRGNAIAGGMRISNGEITVRASTFDSNHSLKNGGALYLDDCAPTCSVINSTFFGNESGTYGGAIFGNGVLLENVTFVKNRAEGHGGALFGEPFTIHNSLFVDNESGNPWGQARHCSATGIGSQVLQWSGELQNGGGDLCVPEIIEADPKLSALGAHGGPTPTLVPGAGSPAFDAGSQCPADDQRGQPRSSVVCDLGAVEVSP